MVALLCSTLIVAGSAIYEATMVSDLAMLHRIEGVRAENAIGLFSYVGIIVALWLSSDVQGGRRLLGYMLLPAFAAAMFLSGNRSGLVALVVSGLLIAFLMRRLERRLIHVLVVAAVMLGSAFLVSSVAPLAVQRTLDIPVEGIVAPAQSEPEGRVILALAALRMFRDHPILGVGFGGFSELFGRYQPYYPRSSAVSHNTFMGTLAELGIVGTGVLLLIYWEASSRLWRARRHLATHQYAAVYAMVLLTGVNVVNAALHGTSISRLMFVVFALGTVVSRLMSNSASEAYSPQSQGSLPLDDTRRRHELRRVA